MKNQYSYGKLLCFLLICDKFTGPYSPKGSGDDIRLLREQVTYVNYSNLLEGIKTSFLIFMKNFDKRNSSNEIKVYILNKN